MIEATILGGSGYTGGELIRLLAGHPGVEIAQVISRSLAGRFVHTVHPNMRGQVALKFDAPERLGECDVLFSCLPHGTLAGLIDEIAGRAGKIVDLSADFRLGDEAAYREWYGAAHAAPEWLGRFVYGLPETRRDALREADFVSGVGCNATAVNLALMPLARAGLIERAVVDLKVGSSEGGAGHSAASHHPERSGALRSFAPVSHRHAAEVAQELGSFPLHFSATAVEMVRGVLCTAQVFVAEPLDDRALRRLYGGAYRDEPFVRIVKERTGLYRYPEPKILAGSNFCDVGFEADPVRSNRRVVVISALDNLMKGAAGTAVQAMNVAFGLDEETGLGFPGLHPV